MSYKTTAEKIEVMAAYEAGKEIACNFNGVELRYKKGNAEPPWTWAFRDYDIVPEQWTPPAGEYFIAANGSVVATLESSKERQLFGTEFKTQQDAERAKKDIQFYLWMWHLANELNKGWVPDWNHENQERYRIYILEGVIKKEPRWAANDLSPVFKSEETAQKAIEIMKTWSWYWGE